MTLFLLLLRLLLLLLKMIMMIILVGWRGCQRGWRRHSVITEFAPSRLVLQSRTTITTTRGRILLMIRIATGNNTVGSGCSSRRPSTVIRRWIRGCLQMRWRQCRLILWPIIP